MTRAHAVTPIVIDAADQQRFGLGAGERVIIQLLTELGLHRVEEITIENGSHDGLTIAQRRLQHQRQAA